MSAFCICEICVVFLASASPVQWENILFSMGLCWPSPVLYGSWYSVLSGSTYRGRLNCSWKLEKDLNTVAGDFNISDNPSDIGSWLVLFPLLPPQVSLELTWEPLVVSDHQVGNHWFKRQHALLKLLSVNKSLTITVSFVQKEKQCFSQIIWN